MRQREVVSERHYSDVQRLTCEEQEKLVLSTKKHEGGRRQGFSSSSFVASCDASEIMLFVSSEAARAGAFVALAGE